MADSTATLELRILGADKAVNEVSKFEKGTTRSMTAAEQSVAKALGGIAAQYMSMAAAVAAGTKMISSGVEFNKFVENTTMSFGVMMKSAEAAKGQMKDLYNFAVNSPLTFKETASSAKQLMAYGFAAKELIPTMKSLGTVAIATGHSLDDISYIYGTLKSQGRAYSRDLMQFGMRGIPIYDELAKVMGVTTDKIQKMASEGKIGFTEVEKAFQNMTTNGGRFAGIIEGYMETLTGKASMLSDILEQSAGTGTKGIFNAMKVGVEELTKVIQGDGMQDFFATLSVDLGHIAKIVIDVGIAFVKLAPILSMALKMFIAFMVIKAIPAMLFSIGDMAIKVAIGIQGITASAIASTSALSSMTTGIGLLASAAGAFIVANPWLVALLAIAAVGGTILTIMHVNADKARESEDPNIRSAQLNRDIRAYGNEARANIGTGPSNSTASITRDVTEVAKLAKEYRLADNVVADMLIKQNQLSKSAWDQFKATKATGEAAVRMVSELAMVKDIAAASTSDETKQANFLSGLTGKDAMSYYDPNDINALGTRGANDYIASFADKMKADSDKYGEAFTPDMKKANLESEMKALYSALDTGAKIPNLFEKTGFDETTIARILEITKLIEKMGGKATVTAKAVEKIKKSWTDREWAAKVTETQLDDIQLTMDKALYAANEEYSLRYSLEVKSSEDAIALAKEQQRVINNIRKNGAIETAKAIQDENIKAFERMKGNDPEFWNSQAAKAGAGDRGAAASMSLQGTDTGKLMAGGDPLTMVITALAEMALTIENVNKSFNFLGTIFEAMRPLMEGSMNNAFQIFVDMLSAFGAAMAPLMPILAVMMKFGNIITYILMVPLIWALQYLAAGFTWFYDVVIVPVGNAIIQLINGVLKSINSFTKYISKLTGVKIAKLPLIDELEKTAKMIEDFNGTTQDMLDVLKTQADTMYGYLTSTIKAFTSKINGTLDKQIKSYEDLYNVGGMSGADLAAKTEELNKGRVSFEESVLSNADEQLLKLGTTGDLYTRLGELVNIKKAIDDNPDMTAEDMISVMTKGGILTPAQLAQQNYDNITQAIKDGFNAWLSSQGKVTLPTVPTATTSPVVTPPITPPSAITPTGNLPRETKPMDEATWDTFWRTGGGQVADKTLAERQALWEASGAFMSFIRASDMNMQMYTIAKNAGDAALSHFLSQKGFATGTPNVPNDMMASIHKGEGIVPSTFMQGIRSGKLTLSGKGGASTGNTVVNVTVQGSVSTERDIAKSISDQIYKMQRSGVRTN